jgi:hypothetical protein
VVFCSTIHDLWTLEILSIYRSYFGWNCIRLTFWLCKRYGCVGVYGHNLFVYNNIHRDFIEKVCEVGLELIILTKHPYCVSVFCMDTKPSVSIIEEIFGGISGIMKEMILAFMAIIPKTLSVLLWLIVAPFILLCVFVSGTLYPKWVEWGEGF